MVENVAAEHDAEVNTFVAVADRNGC